MNIVIFKPGTLSFEAAWVWSVLWGRVRSENAGTSRRQLWEATGLHRTTTLPHVLAELHGHALLGVNKKKLFPFKPPAEWVFPVEGRHWLDLLGYFPVKEPVGECPLSRVENIVFWKMRNLIDVWKKPYQTAKGVASLLGLTRYRTEKAFIRLKTYNLIIPTAGGLRVGDLPNWWAKTARPKAEEKADEPRAEKAEAVAQKADPWEGTRWSGLMESILGEDPTNRWLRATWAPRIYDTLNDHYLNFMYGDHDWNWASHILADARRQHAKTGQARSCFGIFEKMLTDAIAGSGHGFEFSRTGSGDEDPFQAAVDAWERQYDARKKAG